MAVTGLVIQCGDSWVRSFVRCVTKLNLNCRHWDQSLHSHPPITYSRGPRGNLLLKYPKSTLNSQVHSLKVCIHAKAVEIIHTWHKLWPQIFNFAFDGRNFSRSMCNLPDIIPIQCIWFLVNMKKISIDVAEKSVFKFGKVGKSKIQL